MRELIPILLTSIIFSGCILSSTTPDFTDEANYVSSVSKLPSPDGKRVLYQYWVKYPEARYGHTRFTILPATENFQPSSDFFSFNDTLYGWNIIGWRGDTIQSLCITPSQQPPQELTPYKREVKRVRSSYWRQDYYYANSYGGTTDKYFDSISYTQEIVTFIGRDTSSGQVQEFIIVAKRGEVTVPLGDSIIRVSKLEALTTIDGKYNGGDTLRRPPLVSLTNYLLRPKRQANWRRLKDFGVFVEQPFRK
jgi:hypothetical protein